MSDINQDAVDECIQTLNDLARRTGITIDTCGCCSTLPALYKGMDTSRGGYEYSPHSGSIRWVYD